MLPSSALRHRVSLPSQSRDDDLDGIDTTRIGLKGSPTKVKKTFVPQRKTGGIKLEPEDVAEGTKELFKMLNDASII